MMTDKPAGPGRILIVDDDPQQLDYLSFLLEKKNLPFETATTAKEALNKLDRGEFDLLLTDFRMPEMNGLQLLEAVRSKRPDVRVVIITAHGSIQTAIDAVRKGAFGFLVKPYEAADLYREVDKVFEVTAVREENKRLREELDRAARRGRMIGSDSTMLDIYKLVDTVAPTTSTVLILGESGTGKELIAWGIHQKSPRKDKPFIKVNCGALPEGILESELFGHEKGAFTGAVSRRLGRFELADRGTLFLDEIGEISPSLQAKLLRVLQEREFERVGGMETIKCDVRLISATNKDLAEEVRTGRFREDLYYRLNVITITSPPLRTRKGDIPLLVSHFLEKFREEMNRGPMVFTEDALAALVEYDWPGNVRELQNVIERSVTLTRKDKLGVAELPDHFARLARRAARRQAGADDRAMDAPMPEYDDESTTGKSLKEAKHEFERKFITAALENNGWNITRTAESIGIARKNLQEKIKQYSLHPPDGRQDS